MTSGHAAVVAGPDDHGLGEALEAEGVAVTRVDNPVTGAKLDAAGLADADLFVLTDTSESTAVPVALDRNEALRVVVYADDTIPEFVRAQVDLSIDAALLSVEAVAEELARGE